MFRREADIEGGRTIYGKEYISALQNRNKTNLLEALNSAPLIVEEIIPEDSDTRYLRGQITKVIKGGGDWLGRMSGLSRIPGGLQQIAQQNQNRFMSRIEFELQSLFLPLQGFTRDILFQYESFTTQYRTGSAIGGFSGAAIGYYYLGPVGAQIGGVVGSLFGGLIEEAITDPNYWEDLLKYGPAGDIHAHLRDEEDELDPSGGLPDITFVRGTIAIPGEEYGSVLRMRRRMGDRLGRMRIARVERSTSRRLI